MRAIEMKATEAIAAIKAIDTTEELDAFMSDETRSTVVAASAAQREVILAPPGAENDGVEDDGLVEVTTAGDVGTHRDLYINGVASSVPCGIVMRVTPEVVEQLRQCNLL